ncbi:ROK family protein [Pseudarthrobacter sp. NPDC092419]|uniref:ROK family protein n=1 Tax=Pseudarthrobacter sp. NPDC092419 TaxID=3364414 RepID=UPI003817635C
MTHPHLPTPVLEIGGTHVTAALVHGPGGTWRVAPDSVVRRGLDAHAPAAGLLDRIAEAASGLGTGHSGTWGVALPGPFDYAAGVALYEHVGKFDELKGVDVGAELARRLGTAARSISFLNDADAFGIGEVALGAAGGSHRAACITLGTGVGSSFLADGVPVKSGSDVPPDGSCYLLEYNSLPLEETVSRRAIRRAYADAAGGNHDDAGAPDVREIAGAARTGDPVAAAVLDHAFGAAGAAAAPFLKRFGAEVLVVGGSMTGSWDLVEPALRRGIASVEPDLARLPLRKAERSEEAGLVGAAYWAMAAGSAV